MYSFNGGFFEAGATRMSNSASITMTSNSQFTMKNLVVQDQTLKLLNGKSIVNETFTIEKSRRILSNSFVIPSDGAVIAIVSFCCKNFG